MKTSDYPKIIYAWQEWSVDSEGCWNGKGWKNNLFGLDKYEFLEVTECGSQGEPTEAKFKLKEVQRCYIN